MLVEFSVSNFRSIRERQILSMVPGASKRVRSRFSHPTTNKQLPFVLKYAGLYGANSAGKSNIVEAFRTFRTFVARSQNIEETAESHFPVFRLDPSCRNTPTEMEIVFLKDGTLYQYGFSILNNSVTGEWLFATPPGGRQQRWIDRGADIATHNHIYINPSVTGERKVWAESTRDDALALTTAVSLNAKSLQAPFSWITEHIKVISEPTQMRGVATAALCEGRSKIRVINILRECGIAVQDIIIREEEVNYLSLFSDSFLKMAPPEFGKPVKRVFFVYNDTFGRPVEMSLDEESDGTKVIFNLIGPLLDVTSTSRVLIADELHRSLHPHAFKYLLERFFLGETSTKGQLIFTTHESFVLSENLTHPDQIYMVGKDRIGGTVLSPLSDFRLRSDEAVRAGYLAGRYGGLPQRHLPLDEPSNG